MIPRPRVFIGSSKESLGLAEALKEGISHFADAKVWSEGVFVTGSTSIESICEALKDYDYAAFIFSPDDVTTMRGTTLPSPRDNVIFELGLFTGKLGRQRTFIALPLGEDLRLPSDLFGVVPTFYRPTASSEASVAEILDASEDIINAMRKTWKAWDDDIAQEWETITDLLRTVLLREIEASENRAEFPPSHELSEKSALELLQIRGLAVPEQPGHSQLAFDYVSTALQFELARPNEWDMSSMRENLSKLHDRLKQHDVDTRGR